MKIAIMAPLVTAIREPQRGGSQAFVSDLARGLASRGHEVHVYAASGSEIPGVKVIDTGVDPRALTGTLYRAFGPAGSESAAAESAFASAYMSVQQIRYDVIHNHAFDAPAVRLATALHAPRCTRSTYPRTRLWRRRFVIQLGAADRQRLPPCLFSRRTPGAVSSASMRSSRLTYPQVSSPGRGQPGMAPYSLAD